MNAGPKTIVGLLSNASQRFVIPVYQRSYSWDKEQVEQLWLDILSIDKRQNGMHFTGSVVWVQDGVYAASGATPFLIIDGQQRITTITLLLIALAQYAKDHEDEQLIFSYDQLIAAGFIYLPFERQGYPYKLELSQGDKKTLESIIDNLRGESLNICHDSPRLIENLEFFKKRIVDSETANRVWNGINRLEIVSVSLDQAHDNPQLIFESMNSTGKDLSSGDLIRNFILMGQGIEEQKVLYKKYWRPIELVLNSAENDKVFDDFIYNYLTITYAPTIVKQAKIYPTFKRYVAEEGYDSKDKIEEFLEGLLEYAKIYACVVLCKEEDNDIRHRLEDISNVGVRNIDPLLMFFYKDYKDGRLSKDNLMQLIAALESYVFRRSVCGLSTSSYNKYFPSLVGHLKSSKVTGKDYVDRFIAHLLIGDNASKRYPTDSEFKRELKTRNLYEFTRCKYMLAKLENYYHPKDLRDFNSGVYTIEHIMPQNALNHDEWIDMLGDNYEDKFDSHVNNLGNLTLTAYNSELSDGTFKDKKNRIVGGYDNEILVISNDLKNTKVWNTTAIESRANRLAELALNVWPMFSVDNRLLEELNSSKKKQHYRKHCSINEMIAAGLISAGDTFIPTREGFKHTCTLNESGKWVLDTGQAYNSPSSAAKRVVELANIPGSNQRNGYTFWMNENGVSLYDLREEFESTLELVDGGSVSVLREKFWNKLMTKGSDNLEFVEVFGDRTHRKTGGDAWVHFPIGMSDASIHSICNSQTNTISIAFADYTKDFYKILQRNKSEVNEVLEPVAEEVVWDDGEDKSCSILMITEKFNIYTDDWDKALAWFIKELPHFAKTILSYIDR